MERAIHYAANAPTSSDGVAAIVEVLKDPAVEIDHIDRVLLAQYLIGDYRRPAGRPRKSERKGIHALPHNANTAVQEAARLAREDMRELRVTGDRIRGAKRSIVERRAKEYGVDPERVENAYRRGNAREMT